MNSNQTPSQATLSTTVRRCVGVATLITAFVVGQSGAAHGAPAFEPAAAAATTGPPQAAFTITPAQPYVNETVTFKDTSSGNDVDQSWDLNGDGVFGDATGATPTLSWSQLQSLGVRDDGAHVVTVEVKIGRASCRERV